MRLDHGTIPKQKRRAICARKNPPERNPSGGSYSLEHLQQTAGSDHGIGPVGQLKVELRDTEPAALATVTVTVGRDPREQRPK